MSARLSGWGRYPTAACRVMRCREDTDVAAVLEDASSLIARGNGRAYGDAALNPAATALMRPRDRMRAFDPETGRLTCDAGVLLSEVLDAFVPRGWFPPVTPGTRLVTIGGMIAADVHGKNHHRVGSFGRHVERLRLMRADGGIVSCGPGENTDLFRATVGGMGLTGVILDATFRLHPIESAYARQETLACPDLDALMAALDESRDWTHSVAWIDGVAQGTRLGRGLLMRGEHAPPEALPATKRSAALTRRPPRRHRVPVDLPAFALNRATVSAFNALYHGRGAARAGREEIVDLETFFYPLDALLDWNRVYGRRGFVQYQCVLPRGQEDELRRVLETVAAGGDASFLAVLKLFGPAAPDAGFLSFPREGFTLALDFPVRTRAFQLLDGLDRMVADAGGRIYLAKDARTAPEIVAAGYPDLKRFQSVRSDTGADVRFSSLLSQRVGL